MFAAKIVRYFFLFMLVHSSSVLPSDASAKEATAKNESDKEIELSPGQKLLTKLSPGGPFLNCMSDCTSISRDPSILIGQYAGKVDAEKLEKLAHEIRMRPPSEHDPAWPALIDLEDDEGSSLLYMTARVSGDSALLLRCGADPLKKNDRKQLPVFGHCDPYSPYIAGQGLFNATVVERLRRFAQGVAAMDLDVDTPIFHYILWRVRMLVGYDQEQALRDVNDYLQHVPSLANQPNAKGYLPLECAMRHGDLADLLLQHRANPNVLDARSRTMFHRMLLPGERCYCNNCQSCYCNEYEETHYAPDSRIPYIDIKANDLEGFIKKVNPNLLIKDSEGKDISDLAVDCPSPHELAACRAVSVLEKYAKEQRRARFIGARARLKERVWQRAVKKRRNDGHEALVALRAGNVRKAQEARNSFAAEQG